MEPSPLDNKHQRQEHDHEARTRALEIRMSLEELKSKDAFTLLRTEMNDSFTLLRTQMNDGFALLRAELAQAFSEEALARAELELRLRAEIQASENRTNARLDRLEAKMDAQFQLLLRLHFTTIALVLGLAAKMFWPLP